MKPLLAHIYEPHRVTFPCYVQPKLNGIRALYQNGHFQSRDQLPFSVGLLDHLSKPLRSVFSPDVILDGELYVHGWPLQRINAAVTPVRQQPTEDTLKVEYHIFDVVDFGKPFRTRYFFDTSYVCPNVFNVQTIHCGTEQLANELYARFVSQGYEGMMYRLGDCPYTVPKQEWDTIKQWSIKDRTTKSRYASDKNNRVWHLLKRKDWQDAEYRCVAVVEGEGKYTGMLGALVCETTVPVGSKLLAYTSSNAGGTIQYATKRQFHIGSGLTDADRVHYWANPPIGRLIKVKYLCLSSDGIPLNPTILAIL